MPKRPDYYEVALHTFLAENGYPVEVGARDAALSKVCETHGARVPDFLVRAPRWTRLVHCRGYKDFLENQVSEQELAGWNALQAEGYQTLLTWVYPEPRGYNRAHFDWMLLPTNDKHYIFGAISVADYQAHTVVRSERWKTVGVPKKEFDEYLQPLSALLKAPAK